MNNFFKNPFNSGNNQTKIAGNYVVKNSDGGRVSLDSIRENMNNLKNPKSNLSEQPTLKPQVNNDKNYENTRMRMQSFRNIGKK